MFALWKEVIPGFNPSLGDDIPSIEPFLVRNPDKAGAVVICPGGGYELKAPHEGEPVAKWLNSIGLSAFVLNYRVSPYKQPYPFIDAQRAMRVVRFNADKWNIDANRVGILGFSAGGHLASTVGTRFDYGTKDSGDPVERLSSRPDAMILCYPVITFKDYRHEGSMLNLLGEKHNKNLRHHLSSENGVTSQTPPTFLWHTADDNSVPVENSILFASSLSKYKIPFELHVFPKGIHGLGLAEETPEIAQWTKLCEKWLKNIEFINK